MWGRDGSEAWNRLLLGIVEKAKREVGGGRDIALKHETGSFWELNLMVKSLKSGVMNLGELCGEEMLN